MQSNSFLESDFLSTQRVLVFGVNRLQSQPTFRQIKDIDQYYTEFRNMGFDQVYCVTFSDFPLFEQMVAHLSQQVVFVQDRNIDGFKKLLRKFGNSKFLTEHWQFVCVLNQGQVEFYREHPFDPTDRDPDTRRNIYGNIKPAELIELLNSSTQETTND
jgi:peroxiredoxin